MKIRYTHQRRKNDCSSCCIVNAAKHYGAKISYKDNYQAMCDILGVETDCGASLNDVIDLIRHSTLPYKIKKVDYSPNVRKFKKQLATSNPFMFVYNGHMSLVIKYNKGSFTLINHYSYISKTVLKFREFKKLFKGDTYAIYLKENY